MMSDTVDLTGQASNDIDTVDLTGQASYDVGHS